MTIYKPMSLHDAAALILEAQRKSFGDDPISMTHARRIAAEEFVKNLAALGVIQLTDWPQ